MCEDLLGSRAEIMLFLTYPCASEEVLDRGRQLLTEEKAQAVRLVRQLGEELGTEHGAIPSASIPGQYDDDIPSLGSDAHLGSAFPGF
jgi:hypothetical protein